MGPHPGPGPSPGPKEYENRGPQASPRRPQASPRRPQASPGVPRRPQASPDVPRASPGVPGRPSRGFINSINFRNAGDSGMCTLLGDLKYSRNLIILRGGNHKIHRLQKFSNFKKFLDSITLMVFKSVLGFHKFNIFYKLFCIL